MGYMNIFLSLPPKSPACELYGCLSATVHGVLAWGFVGVFLTTVACAAYLERRRRREEEKKAALSGQGDENWAKSPNKREQTHHKRLNEEPVAYQVSKSAAENLKAILQMAIGVITVCVVGWRFLYAPDTGPAKLILEGTGVGLAAAAALELAFTLFTPGPDEALDPLMLALSATILLKLSETSISLANAGAFLLLGVLLAVLFATRLMLAERAEGDPHIWWIPRRRHGKNQDDEPDRPSARD
jgi:hypothetical protein